MPVAFVGLGSLRDEARPFGTISAAGLARMGRWDASFYLQERAYIAGEVQRRRNLAGQTSTAALIETRARLVQIERDDALRAGLDGQLQ